MEGVDIKLLKLLESKKWHYLKYDFVKNFLAKYNIDIEKWLNRTQHFYFKRVNDDIYIYPICEPAELLKEYKNVFKN